MCCWARRGSTSKRSSSRTKPLEARGARAVRGVRRSPHLRPARDRVLRRATARCPPRARAGPGGHREWASARSPGLVAARDRPPVPLAASAGARGVSSSSAEKALVLTLASSAGVHGGLVPAHAAEAPVLEIGRAHV